MGGARDRDSLNAPRDKVQHIFLTSPSRHSTHVHAHTHTHIGAAERQQRHHLLHAAHDIRRRR